MYTVVSVTVLATVTSDNATPFARLTLLLSAAGVNDSEAPSNSRLPASGVVRNVPDVSFSGGLVAVPAAKCRRAVGEVVPIPTFPLLSTRKRWLPWPSAKIILLDKPAARPVTLLPRIVL